jgi:hypothetical protein
MKSDNRKKRGEMRYIICAILVLAMATQVYGFGWLDSDNASNNPPASGIAVQVRRSRAWLPKLREMQLVCPNLLRCFLSAPAWWAFTGSGEKWSNLVLTSKKHEKPRSLDIGAFLSPSLGGWGKVFSSKTVSNFEKNAIKSNFPLDFSS